MPIWLAKIVATRIIKAVKHKVDLKRIDKYVNKPNELDKQMKQVQRNINKCLKTQEKMEKDLAIVIDILSKSDSIKDKFKNIKKQNRCCFSRRRNSFFYAG